MHEKADVLIVGAGPTGLSLALTLDKLGVSFQIIDQKEKPDDISKAMLVVPGTLEHYSQLGLVDDVLAAGIEPHKIELHNKQDTITIDIKDYRSNISRYPRLLTYPQDEHERLLVNTLKNRGHDIHWQTRFLDLKDDDSEVVVEMEKDGQRFFEAYRYVVGADGGSSAVRKTLEIAFEGDTNAKRFFVADVELNNRDLRGEVVHAFFLNQDFLLCFPLRDQSTKRLIGILPETLAAKEKVQTEEFIPFMQEHYGLEITNIKWFSEYKVHHRLAEEYQKGNVFLAGDAAHLHSPIGGQGMNAGIADAVNIGWKLAHVLQNKVHKRVLETYEEERKTYAKKLVSTTDLAFKIVTADSQMIHKIRNYLIATLAEYAIKKTDRVSDMLFKLISQAKIQYTDSSLNAYDVSNKIVGARLPYFKENLEYIDDMRWHVQVYGSTRKDLKQYLDQENIPYYEMPWEEAMKEEGFFKNTAYLIRPDGYIAWVNEDQDAQSLEDYLTKWGISI